MGCGTSKNAAKEEQAKAGNAVRFTGVKRGTLGVHVYFTEDSTPRSLKEGVLALVCKVGRRTGRDRRILELPRLLRSCPTAFLGSKPRYLLCRTTYQHHGSHLHCMPCSTRLVQAEAVDEFFVVPAECLVDRTLPRGAHSGIVAEHLLITLAEGT